MSDNQIPFTPIEMPNGRFAHDESDAVNNITFNFRLHNSYHRLNANIQVVAHTLRQLSKHASSEQWLSNWTRIIESVHDQLRTQGYRDNFEVFAIILYNFRDVLERALIDGVQVELQNFHMAHDTFVKDDIIKALVKRHSQNDDEGEGCELDSDVALAPGTPKQAFKAPAKKKRAVNSIDMNILHIEMNVTINKTVDHLIVQ
jgi:Asp-tRNA(Asn)/Glu-tRNA(Gln) amidotransferase A subunit family amidase